MEWFEICEPLALCQDVLKCVQQSRLRACIQIQMHTKINFCGHLSAEGAAEHGGRAGTSSSWDE
eukprot:66820-Amphidinium_carterae.1